MNSKYFKVGALLVLFCGCNKLQKQDIFEIDKGRIGLLTKETVNQQLDSIFANDSIVKRNASDTFISSVNEIEVYEKGGAKLLVLEVEDAKNIASKITSIKVIDPRYKTKKGLTAVSTFKDVKEQYEVTKINNTLSSAVVFIDAINAYFTIDKKELSKELQSGTDNSISIYDIPDSAVIKDFWISWDSL